MWFDKVYSVAIASFIHVHELTFLTCTYSRGRDNDSCCLAPKMVVVHGGSRGTQLAAIHSLRNLLYTTVFDISGMATPGKGYHPFHGLYG